MTVSTVFDDILMPFSAALDKVFILNCAENFHFQGHKVGKNTHHTVQGAMVKGKTEGKLPDPANGQAILVHLDTMTPMSRIEEGTTMPASLMLGHSLSFVIKGDLPLSQGMNIHL